MIDALLEEGALSVVFQPIVDLASGRVRGYEALGRVAHAPPEVPRSPDALLDLAAREGSLLALDRAWRKCAIDRIALEAREGREWFFLNTDSRVIDAPDFAPGFTFALLAQRGIAPERIVLELGERSPSLAHARTESLARHYAAQGFRVALDDVGRGHATLGAVLSIRPQIVKLDGSLVRSLDADPEGNLLVHALADTAARIGATLVAEGIETPRQLVAVMRAGVRYGQGYLLGRPCAELAPIPPESAAILVWASHERARNRAPARSMRFVPA